MPDERRKKQEPVKVERRGARHDYVQEKARLEYYRSWVAMLLAVFIVAGVLIAALLTEVGNQAVILALLGFAGTILGLPYAQKIDRYRQRDEEDDPPPGATA